jgi:hypothetical protein
MIMAHNYAHHPLVLAVQTQREVPIGRFMFVAKCAQGMVETVGLRLRLWPTRHVWKFRFELGVRTPCRRHARHHTNATTHRTHRHSRKRSCARPCTVGGIVGLLCCQQCLNGAGEQFRTVACSQRSVCTLTVHAQATTQPAIPPWSNPPTHPNRSQPTQPLATRHTNSPCSRI